MTQPFAHWSTLTRLLVGLLLLVLPLGGLACGGGDDETPSPGVTLKSITVSPATANVAVGATQQFAVNGVYSDGKTKAVTTGVTWTSSTTTVATINTSGLATAVADGSTTITATIGKYKATANLTVITKALTGIQVTPASASIGVGTTQQYAATANYNDGTTTDVTASATWSSSATATATISATGLASGVAAGTSTISATFETVSGTAILTVTDNAMTGIVVTPATASIPAGATQAFTATAQYADGTTQNVTADVTWTSSDTAVATIAATGTATGVAEGTATITAAHSGLTGTATLTVTEAEITELQITPATEDAIVGGPNVEFTATAIYSDGTSVDVTDTATWSSSDDAIATIDAGAATAVAAGTATITAEFDGETDTAELTVTDAVLDSIVVTPATASIPAGTTQQFTAVGYYNNGTSLDISATASWVSSATTVATVDAGLASGVAAGTSTITATLAGVSGSAELTVTDVVLSSIQITPAVASIADGATQAYSALGTYSDNSTADLTAIVSWTSSVPAVATIAANGLATAEAPGTTTITAAYQGITSNSATLVVTNVVVTGISVTCAATTIADGTDTQCTAQATYSDGSNGNVTSLATWTTNDDAIASVNQLGLVSGEGAGTATITAAYQGFSGTVNITVTAATLTAIQVTPPAPSIADGTTQQFVATGTYSDGSTQVITTAVTWTSSNTTVATITLGGLATGNAPGQSTITAALSGITGTATLTVTAATVQTLTIAPLTPSIAKGGTVQFTATANFTDGTQQNVTSAAAWTTSAAATATVVAGLATGVEVGTATITASYGGQSAGTLLTVTGATVTSVHVEPAAASIADGTTQQFTAYAILSDGTNTGTLSTGVTWTSSTGAVATINAAGLATAVNPGTTNIRATYQTVQSAPAVLTVTNAVPTILDVTPPTASIADGTTQPFVATVTLSDGTTQNVTSAASWTSSSTATATVVAGLATAVNPGTTTITATYQGLNDTASLTVTAAALTGITISTTDNNIPLGSQTTFTAVGTYTDGSTQQISNLVTWSQTPTGILSFGTGTAASVPATGATVGTTSVTATMPGVPGVTSNALSVQVVAVNLVSIAITPSVTQSRYVGETIQFTAVGSYDDGSNQTLTIDPGLTWETSSGTAVSISNTTNKGLATALAVGTSNITARVGTIVSNATTVNVLASPGTLVSITLDPANHVMNVGASRVFAATAHYQDGTTGNLTGGTWTVENLAGAVVSHLTLATTANLWERNATAVTPTTALPGGLAYVAVASGAIKTRAAVDVNDTAVTAVAVTCPVSSCLPTGIGFQTQCTATATYSDGTTANVTGSASWTSSSSGVATVATGLVTVGSTAGSTNIAASFGGQTSPNLALTAAAQTLQSLAVSPATASIHVAETVQLAANATYQGTGTCAGTRVFNVANIAGWSSSASAATVSAGLVTGNSAGLASITATHGGLSAVATVTVSAACIQSVAIGTIGASNTVPTNITVPLTVTATYNDGTLASLSPASPLGTWNNSAVDANWRLTVGTANISNLTFTVNTASACTPPVNDSIDVAVNAAAVLAEVRVQTLAGAETAQNMVLGGTADFRAMATYTGYGTFNVSQFATWNNTPAIQGLTNAAGPGTLPQPARRFSHTGTVGGTTNIFANYKTQASANTLQLTVASTIPTLVTVALADFSPAPNAVNGYPGGLTVGVVARVTYSDGSVATNPSCITWASNNAAITFADAAVPTAQTVTPATAQSVTLTATCTFTGGSVAGTGVVNVNTATLTEMAFNPASGQTRALNTTTGLTVVGVYSNGNQFDISNQVAYNDPTPTVASILAYDPTLGLRVQTHAVAGLVTFTFTKGTLSRGYNVNVTGGCISNIAFTIPTANPVNLGVGEEASFRATATDTAGTTSNVTGSGQWSATNAFLTNAGTTGSGTTLARVYRGLAVGNTKVVFTYTDASVCDGGNPADNTIVVERDVTVNANVIASLEIRPQPVTGQLRRRLPRGQHVQLQLLPRYTDGTYGADLASAAGTAWSINDVGAATPTVGASTGLLYAGTLIGVDEVQATYGGFTATLPIEVFDCGTPTVTIASTATGNLPIGQTRDYTAVASYGTSAGCQLDATERTNLPVTTVATWNSSVPARAAFNTTPVNRVSAIAAGATDITAVYNGDTSNTIVLNVVAVTLQSLTISASAASTYVGGMLEVTVSAVWTDGTNTYNLTPPTISAADWLYGTPGAISIQSGGGPVTYMLRGDDPATGATLRARQGTVLSNVLSFNVVNDCVAAVRIVGADPTQPANTQGMVDFECQLNNAATWADCNSSFALSGDPIFVGNAIGTDGAYTITATAAAGDENTITATYQGSAACPGATLSAESVVTVGAATLTAVAITSGPSTVARNYHADYVATATFTCASCTATSHNVTGLATWTSSNTSVATFGTPAGRLNTANVAGSTYISASYGALTTPLFLVTVADKIPTSVTISAAPNRVSAVPAGADAEYPRGGWLLQLNATAVYSDGSTDSNPTNVAWTIDAGTAGTVSTTGLFTTGALTSTGLVTVKAVHAYNAINVEDTFIVRVVYSAGGFTAVSIVNADGAAATTSVADGLTQDYAARATYGGAVYWFTRNVDWFSSSAGVGTIAQAGNGPAVFTAVAPGSTQITAARGTVIGTVDVTVTSAVPQYIYCVPSTLTLASGSKAQLYARVHLSDGSFNDVTTAADTSWTSTDVAVAEFNANDPKGVISAKAAGTTYAVPAYQGLPIDDADRCVITVPTP